MNIIQKDNLVFELRIESLEDLWMLSQFIIPGDKIFATSERKVNLGENKTKQIKKIIPVDLLVKKISFENNSLRITGEIQNETEFTAIGQSHTLTFNPNDSIKITKINLLKFEEKMLNSAINSKKSKNFVVLFDKDDLIASEFSEFNFTVLFEKKGLGSKKYTSQEINEEEEKFKILEEFLKRDYSNIIFAGPGHYKDKLSKYIHDKTNQKTTTFQFPDVSTTAIQRLIKAISEKGILTDSQISHENEYMQKLLENINKGSKYIYGEKETANSVNEGRVETLLISTKLINSKREDSSYQELNETMKTVEQTNGQLVIINSKNETGKVLDGLGGIGGILRY